jgi:hypothetical protein
MSRCKPLNRMALRNQLHHRPMLLSNLGSKAPDLLFLSARL